MPDEIIPPACPHFSKNGFCLLRERKITETLCRECHEHEPSEFYDEYHEGLHWGKKEGQEAALAPLEKDLPRIVYMFKCPYGSEYCDLRRIWEAVLKTLTKIRELARGDD